MSLIDPRKTPMLPPETSPSIGQNRLQDHLAGRIAILPTKDALTESDADRLRQLDQSLRHESVRGDTANL